MIKLARAGLAAGLAASTVLAGVSAAAPKAGLAFPVFDPPVLLTPTEGFGGHEPSLAIDAHDNIWVTAHRTYVPGAPDSGARTGARTAAWLWVSADGKTFSNPPGLNELRANELQFGLEGDVATDASGNVHFVDLGPASTTYTTWRTTGRGQYEALRSAPTAGVLTADRPFVAANGKTVLLAVNDAGTYPLAPSDSDLTTGEAAGQYAMYVSRDGGKTFPATGFRAGESRFCRPHVTRRSPDVLIAVCSAFLLDSLEDEKDDDGMLVFASKDGGTTWSKQLLLDAGPSSAQGLVSFPSVAETRDGRLHFLFHRTVDGADGSIARSDLLLSTSADGGSSWSAPRTINPEPGQWQLTSIAADPRTGRLGLAGYHRSQSDRPWDFRAAVFEAAAVDIVSQPVAGGLAAYPAGDLPAGEFTQAAFDSRGRLNVTYSARELPALQPAANGQKLVGSSKIFFARQR